MTHPGIATENLGRNHAELLKARSQGGGGITKSIINIETVLSSHIILGQVSNLPYLPCSPTRLFRNKEFGHKKEDKSFYLFICYQKCC